MNRKLGARLEEVNDLLIIVTGGPDGAEEVGGVDVLPGEEDAITPASIHGVFVKLAS